MSYDKLYHGIETLAHKTLSLLFLFSFLSFPILHINIEILSERSQEEVKLESWNLIYY